jgi:biotin carboxylase
MHPIADWSVSRIAQLCEVNRWQLTIITIGSSNVGDGISNLHEWLRVDDLSEELPVLLEQIGTRRFDVVIPGNEFAVVAAELLAEWLGIYHNDVNKIKLARDKALMREAFDVARIPQPAVRARVASMSECRALDWAQIPLPVIVKPVDMASSLFVRKCNTIEEVERTVEQILGFKRSMITNYDFQCQALIEEFVEGPEFSLECVVEHGVLRQRILTKKFVSPFPGCFEIGHISGVEVPPKHVDMLNQLSEKIAAIWGMPNGIMHIEFKMTDERLWVIEAAARVPGCRIPQLVQMRHGVQIEDTFIRLRAGLPWKPLTASTDAQEEWVGIRFSFPERAAPVVTPRIQILQEHHDGDHVMDGADAFSVDRRSGFMFARSDSFEELCRFIGDV